MKDFCRIYLTDFSQLPDLTCRQLLERLPPSRRERIEGMGAAGRAQSVAAAALLYEGLLEEDRPEGFTLRQIPAGELTAPRLALAAARSLACAACCCISSAACSDIRQLEQLPHLGAAASPK